MRSIYHSPASVSQTPDPGKRWDAQGKHLPYRLQVRTLHQALHRGKMFDPGGSTGSMNQRVGVFANRESRKEETGQIAVRRTFCSERLQS